LKEAAGLIRRFIEDYHEKLEEDFLFPRFEKVKKLTGLVAVLREQHQAGRRLTDSIQRRATLAALKSADDRKHLANDLRLFIRVYRPHEAREDTVLFPAFRSIVSPHEYATLGEEFEDKEHKLFGEDGFEKVVEEVAGLERALGIYDLSSFTPK
jgi:hemerythrin-like domain-containing protein